MVIVHGTKKFLDRVGRPDADPDDVSTTALGSWYATVWFWRPQIALFVNEVTLFPVVLPLAPAATVLDRFAAALETALRRQHIDGTFVERELGDMAELRLAKTANRSVVGIMTEFTQLAEHYRDDTDLDDLGHRLTAVPCSPLYATHTSPDRALAAAARRRRDSEA